MKELFGNPKVLSISDDLFIGIAYWRIYQIEPALASLVELQRYPYFAKPYEPQAKLETFTCYGCPHEPRCSSAWDLYNLEGDCLEEK